MGLGRSETVGKNARKMSKLKNVVNFSSTNEKKSDVNFYLELLINEGIIPFCEQCVILKQRKQIQDEPLVVRELAMRLKDLKKIFKRNCIKSKFEFKTSALKLFELQNQQQDQVSGTGDYWYPLSVRDLWAPFVHCMMTILDEIH